MPEQGITKETNSPRRKQVKTIKFRIKGVRPLMLSAEQPYEQTNGNGAKVKKAQPSAMEQAESHLHKAKVGGKDVCVMPGINVQKSVQAAYPYMPAPGRRKSWKKLVCTLSVEEMNMPIEPQRWTLDARRAGTGFGSGGSMLYRPRWDEWQLSGSVTFNEEHLSEEQVRGLFDNAGQYVGLGAWRVGNRGPYGKFIVSEWKEA